MIGPAATGADDRPDRGDSGRDAGPARQTTEPNRLSRADPFALLVPLVGGLLPVTGALRADVDVVRRARRGARVVHRRAARWLGVLLRIESLGMPSLLSVHVALLGRSRRVLRAAEPA